MVRTIHSRVGHKGNGKGVDDPTGFKVADFGSVSEKWSHGSRLSETAGLR
jgi:hypothetical protein